MPTNFSKNRVYYLIAGIVLLSIEVLIAVFVQDHIIRPHIGDLLVVIMIYCFVRALFNWPVLTAAIVTLLFSYLVEIGQYFKLVELLQLQQSMLARVVIGTHFSWIDMLAYTAGIIIVLLVERKLKSR